MEDLKELEVKNWKEMAGRTEELGETWLSRRKPTKGCSAKCTEIIEIRNYRSVIPL